MLYILIWGTKGVTYTKDVGLFWCPCCESEQNYRRRRCRRFFHLYWIPLMPLQIAGEYIECSGCKGTYRLQVLDHDPERDKTAFEAEFARAVKHVLVGMMLADGRVKSGEIEAVMSMYERVTGQELPPTEVVDLFTAIMPFPVSVTDVLCDLAPVLNEEGKQLVIKAAFFVAASDGCVDPSEHQMLESIGAALEMHPSQVEAAVTSLMDAA